MIKMKFTVLISWEYLYKCPDAMTVFVNHNKNINLECKNFGGDEDIKIYAVAFSVIESLNFILIYIQQDATLNSLF
jgi:hypothetical protein